MLLDPQGKKKVVVATLLAIAVVGGVLVFVLSQRMHRAEPVIETVPEEPVVEVEVPAAPKTIGMSVQGRPIELYSFGTGPTHLLFVGGIHGGYEWNSVLLAYTFIDHLVTHPEFVPPSLTIDVIPSANPDGVFAVIGKEGRFSVADTPGPDNGSGTGRFNAHNVDLNRNFDCKWQPQSTWRGKTVSAGTSAFSEPESRAVRAAVELVHPAVVVFWHSQANAVYASECEHGILPGTRVAMNTYASAAGYPAVDTFDAYTVTGDAEGWLASINIPAITVELKTHETVEWDRNLAGITALMMHYTQ